MRGTQFFTSPVFAIAPPLVGSNYFLYRKTLEYISIEATGFFEITRMTLSQIGLAGFVAAIPTSLIVAPAEQIKIRLQTSNDKFAESWKTSFHFKQFLRGTLITILRDSPGAFIYFATYEGVQRLFISKNFGTILLAGGSSGIMVWLGTIPLDNIKTKIQTESSTTFYKAIKDMCGSGLKSFYRGLTPCVIRAFPTSAAFFLAVESCNSFLA